MILFFRQIFAHQPNRRFVRTCCIDQEGIAWYHFDRSGLYENFGGFYNEEPHNFVRLILGLSSLDEEILGLDTSIRWRLDREGKKAAGTVTVVDERKVSTKFKMIFVEPIFRKNRPSMVLAQLYGLSRTPRVARKCLLRTPGEVTEKNGFLSARTSRPRVVSTESSK